MAPTPARTDLNFEEFRKRLNKERVHLTELHHKERAGIIEENQNASDNELGAYRVFDDGTIEDSAAVLADMERERMADTDITDMLREIDAALARLDDGTYGIDEVTGEPIPIERLRALPWASMTVQTAEQYKP